MQDPKTLSIYDFTYSLPEEKIARYPLSERDDSKLLIYKKGEITEDTYRNLDLHIPEESLLIFNNTKVVEARLLFQKSSGGIIEIFCLEPHDQYADITTAMQQHGKVFWQCLIGGASKWKHGQILEKKLKNAGNEFTLHAKYIEKQDDYFVVELSWNDPYLSFAEILHLAGAIPLPPYLKRNAEPGDEERYQTIYAVQNGSVAAPTAGLHFTSRVFEKLKEKNVHTDFVTLHVGAGTFKPVKSEIMVNHQMHAEYFTINRQTIQNIILQPGKKIIAVGTTSLRTLESLYWLGVQKSGDGSQETGISQWYPYENRVEDISTRQALKFLLNWMEEKNIETLVSKTQILIAPGYQFRIVNGLITNFHQPQSTLLLLVAAFTGLDWKKIYEYALQNEFRFLSYGDGCLLWLPGQKNNS